MRRFKLPYPPQSPCPDRWAGPGWPVAGQPGEGVRRHRHEHPRLAAPGRAGRWPAHGWAHHRGAPARPERARSVPIRDGEPGRARPLPGAWQLASRSPGNRRKPLAMVHVAW